LSALLTIDIGGTRVKWAAWSRPQSTACGVFETRELPGLREEYGTALLSRIGIPADDLTGLAVSLPATVADTADRILSSWTMSRHFGSPVDGLTADGLFPTVASRGLPVMLCNDLTAAAAGCLARQCALPFLCLSLGTFGGAGYSDGRLLYPSEKLGRLTIAATGGPLPIADALSLPEVDRLNSRRLIRRIARSAEAVSSHLQSRALPAPERIFILGGNSRRLLHCVLAPGFTLWSEPELLPLEGLRFLWNQRRSLPALLHPALA